MTFDAAWSGRCVALGSAAALALLAAAAPVRAATPSPPDAPVTVSPTVLGEVLVTAQKREENVQRVPMNITVVKGVELEQRGADTLFAAAPLVSGMVFSRAPDDGLALSFRGLGTPARNQSFDQSIALFLDGAFIGKGRLYGSDVFDLDRIEFIKSTQSTLLGKNTDMGAMSLVTRKPGAVFGGYASAGYEAQNGGYQLDGAVDLPVSDVLAVRLAVHRLDTNGWVRNSVNGLLGPKDDNFGGRMTAVLTPSPGAKFTLTYQYTDDHRIGNAYQYYDPQHVLPPALGEGVVDATSASFVSQGENGDDTHRLKAHIVNLTSELDAGAARITAVSTYITYGMHFVDDLDFGPKDATYFDRREDYWQVSQELRLTSPSDRRFSYVAGLYFFYDDWNSVEAQIFNTPLQVGPTPFETIFQGGFANEFKQRTRTLSAFGEGTWRFNDRLRLSGGVRYTDEVKNGSWARPAFAPFTLWNQVINPPFPKTPLKFSDNFPDANASVEYDFTNDIMLYAAFGLGSKTGGFAESSRVATGNPAVDARIESETTWTYEAGFKASVLGGAAHLNASLFYIRDPTFQDLNFTGAEFITKNIPVRSMGAQAEFVWQLNTWLKLDNAWTYTDAKALLTPSFTPSQSPRWSGYSGASVEFPIAGGALLAGGSAYVRYRSSMHNLRSWTYGSPALTTLDLSATLRAANDRWALSLVGTNVTNAISADFSFPPPDPTLPPSVLIESPAPLRAIWLQATTRF